MSSSANLSRLHELYAADIKDVVAVMVKCNTYTPSAEFLVQKLLATQPDDEEFKIAEREFVELREVRAAMKFMRMYRREYDHYEECLHGTEDDALADWKETAIGMSFYMSRSLRAEENVADPRYTACVLFYASSTRIRHHVGRLMRAQRQELLRLKHSSAQQDGHAPGGPEIHSRASGVSVPVSEVMPGSVSIEPMHVPMSQAVRDANESVLNAMRGIEDLDLCED